MRLRDLIRDRATWIYVALTAVMFHRPLLNETFYFRDLYRHFYPKKVFFADALRSGTFPLWDPLTNGGEPFLASPRNFAFHPSNVLYLFLRPIDAFNLILAAHVLFCAIAAYWLARTLRLQPVAAFVCGSVFAFCGYTLSSANLMHPLLGLPWVPLTLGLVHRALRDGRSLLPAAIAAAMPLYGGAAELTVMLFAVIVVWIFAARIETPMRARVWTASIVIAGAAGLSLLQVLPGTSVVAQSSRSEPRTFDEFASWSVHPLRLPELVVPRFLGDLDALRDADRWGRNLETGGYPYVLSLYLGFGTFLLAAIGAARGGGEVPHRALLFLAFAAFLLSLGRHLPLFRFLFEHVPFIGIFRYPVKAQAIALLPLALLAACGVESIAASRRFFVLASLVFATIAGATAIALRMSEPFAIAFARAFSFTALAPQHRVFLAIALLHASVAALALAFASKNAQLLAAVITLDLLIAGYTVNDYAPRAMLERAPPLARHVRTLVQDGRFHAARRPLAVRSADNDLVSLARWQLATLNGYSAALYGIEVVFHDDWDELGPLRISRASRLMPRFPWEMRLRLLERASVRAFTAPVALTSPNVKDLGIVDGAALHLYVNRSLPRQRFVSTAVVARNDREALLHVLRSGDPSTVVVENARPNAERCGNAPVRVIVRSINAAQYEVDAPCRGLVVFAETAYDGWTATIDGHAAPILNADYAFTAVEVDRGRHRLERRYFPTRLWVGVAGTLMTLLALVIADRYAARSRVRSEPESSPQ